MPTAGFSLQVQRSNLRDDRAQVGRPFDLPHRGAAEIVRRPREGHRRARALVWRVQHRLQRLCQWDGVSRMPRSVISHPTAAFGMREGSILKVAVDGDKRGTRIAHGAKGIVRTYTFSSRANGVGTAWVYGVPFATALKYLTPGRPSDKSDVKALHDDLTRMAALASWCSDETERRLLLAGCGADVNTSTGRRWMAL